MADAAQAPSPKRQKADPKLLFWRRLIEQAVADAKRTAHGLPTDAAILARWWIEEHRPTQSDKGEYERSFEAACGWLNIDPHEERKKRLVEINETWDIALRDYGRTAVYVRRAMVLSCAGVPISIARQYELPLVSEADYEHVAGVDHPDPAAVTARLLELNS